MRRSLLLIPILALAALFGPSVADASAATCATHQVVIVDWTLGTDTVSGLNDFKCGGAENVDYQVVYWLEIWNGSSWVEANCDAGPCESVRPSSGWFAAGTEHSWTWTFNFKGQIDCRTFRPRAQAHFRDSSLSQIWTGPQRQTC